jgi:hypothetical protein
MFPVEVLSSSHLGILLQLRTTPVLRAAFGVSTLMMLGGCLDAPTGPGALQQIAGGEAWIAIEEPRALPSLETWRAYVSAEAREEVDALAAASRDARRRGSLKRAAELERAATGVALRSLERTPNARVIGEVNGALDRWLARVGGSVDMGVYPEVAVSLRRVAASREIAGHALAAGDTAAALTQFAIAAEAIRSHAPTQVALRVLERSEARLRERQTSGTSMRRALHLVRSAREELTAGDPERALRRALYALQLTENAQVGSASEGSRP